jgi:hypothetical protein
MHAAPPRPGSLDAALRAVREAERDMGASDAVRARLQMQVRAHAIGRRQTAGLTLAAAAVLLIGIAASLWQLTATRYPATVLTRADRQEEVVTAFFPLIYGDVPIADGRLVRLEVSRQALATFGLDDTRAFDDRSADTVWADVLVGEDGLARAVRFVGRAR